MHPEDGLLSALLRTGDMRTAQQVGMRAEHFDLRVDEWKWVERFYFKSQRCPSKLTFKNQFPKVTIYKTDDLDHWCHEVKQEYARRATTNLIDEAIDLLVAGSIAPAVNGLGTGLLRVQASIADTPDDYDLVESAMETYEEVKKRVKRVQSGGNPGIPSGFPSFDAASGGLQPGWYGIVGGRLGQGKTWTLARMAAEATMAGYTSLFYSLEQPAGQIAMRTHAIFSHRFGGDIKAMDMMKGNVDLLRYKDFLEQLEDEVPGRLIINDAKRGRVTPMAVAAGIERTECDEVIIDYLTLMSMGGDGGYTSVLALSADLQQLSQRYDIPIVVGSQVNRAGATGDTPDASKLSRADIGTDADFVLTLVQKSRSVMKVSLEKFRHGPGGFNWFCRFKPNDGDYEEITGDEAGDLMELDEQVM